MPQLLHLVFGGELVDPQRSEFRDVGADVQRTKAQGYVRMITLSHRYALPVQIEKFGPRTTD